jgi:hypothetical protein
VQPYFTHPVVLFAWTGAWSTAVLFAWLTLSSSLSRRALGDERLDVYTLFTGLSCAHALSVAVTFVPTSLPVKEAIFQAMWVLGTASLSYWVLAVRKFCGSTSRSLSWIARGLLVVSCGALLDLIQTPISGESWMYEPGAEPPASLALRAAGMFANGSGYARVLGGLCVLFMLTGCTALYRELIRTGSRDPFLYAGIFISGVGTVTEVALSLGNSPYNMPIVFMANLIEGFRITWVTERRRTAELERIRQAKNQQGAIIERQLAELKAISRLAKVGENTARLTHDMRNPLTVALGSLDMLEGELKSPSVEPGEAERLVALARQSLEHVSGLATKVTSQARLPTRSASARSVWPPSSTTPGA